MRISDLNTKVTIKQKATTTDSIGGQSTTWSVLTTAWAFIEPQVGDEAITADQLRAGLVHKITIRWRRDVAVTPKLRIEDGTRVFEVLSVANQGSGNQWLILMAAEVLI